MSSSMSKLGWTSNASLSGELLRLESERAAHLTPSMSALTWSTWTSSSLSRRVFIRLKIFEYYSKRRRQIQAPADYFYVSVRTLSSQRWLWLGGQLVLHWWWAAERHHLWIGESSLGWACSRLHMCRFELCLDSDGCDWADNFPFLIGRRDASVGRYHLCLNIYFWVEGGLLAGTSFGFFVLKSWMKLTSTPRSL